MPKMNRTSAADDAVSAQTAADLAAGKDPFGDDEEIVAESVEDQAKAAKAKLDEANGVTDAAAEGADAAADGATGDDATKTDDKAKDGDKTGDADAAADTTGDADASADSEGGATDEVDEDEDASLEPRPYAGKPLSELETKVAELEGKEAAEFKKLMAGEIDDDAFSKTKSEVGKELRGIQTQIARAEAANDRVREYEMGVITQVSKAAVKDGVVYVAPPKATEAEQKAAAKASKQFDVALNMLVADPDNGRRSFKSLAKEAHAMVLTRHGIAKAKTTPAADATGKGKDDAAAAPTPAARVPAKAPLTLRNIPAAAVPGTGGGVVEEMGKLKGTAYQEAYAKLTPVQKAKLLDE